MSATAPAAQRSYLNFPVGPSTLGFPLANVVMQTGGSITGYSSGAQTILNLPVAPTVTENWDILAWSMSITALRTDFGVAGAWLGACKIIGGLCTDTQPTPITGPPTPGSDYANQRYQHFQALPADSSNLATIWDSESDPPLQCNYSGAPTLIGTPLIASATLNSPLRITNTSPVLAGLWIPPFLCNEIGVQVQSATCCVVYQAAASAGY